MTAPRIETDRLILRPHALSDFAAACAMWSDPIVVQHISGRPSTESQTWMRILNYAGSWSLLGFGYWAVEDKATGTFAGEAGFGDFHRDIVESMRAPEIGWAFAPAFHGRGIATEAVRAIVDWGDKHLGVARTVCLITPENLQSIRVAEKAGYRKFGDGTTPGGTALFFER